MTTAAAACFCIMSRSTIQTGKKPTLCYQRMGLQMWGEPWASLRRMNCDVPFPQILPQLSFALSRRAGIKQGLHFARVQCPVEHFQFIQTTLEEFSTSQP